MPRRIRWVLLVALLLAPLLASLSVATSAFAQDETVLDVPVEGSPTAEVTPSEEPSATATETATEQPTETATATETPVETVVPTETVAPTESATPEPTPATPDNVGASGVPSVSDLTIVVSCLTNPETIRITNNGSADITLTGVSTLIDAVPGEPFTLNQLLRPGKSQLYRAGPAANIGIVLTTSYLFTNSAYDLDGVVFNTSAGDVTQKCAPKPDPVVANPGKLADLKIELSCRSNAEGIRVTNTGTGYFLLKNLRTTYKPSSEEPFSINQVLAPGKQAYFQAGAGANRGTILTKGFIFDNGVWEKDGVRIATSVGNVTKQCDKKPLPPEHWVDVNLSQQFLRAYEGNKLVNSTYVSTGRPGFDTPTGTFYIIIKYRYDDMEGVINGEYYNVPAVPWTMYFTNYGHALHGAYWHNNFGHVMSHGCVNLPLGFAEWLYYWLPYGGRVVIHY